MLLNIHSSIIEKLDYFISIHKIPNIIFHGPNGSGKRSIVNQFIYKIYNHNKEKIKDFVMYVNCAHGKGIKFIRDELKFFAKTNINSNGGDIFKSIILLNADKLTMDAQSALRRCIELFSHTTRFFIIVEDKYKLLKPILSRFCEIYIYRPIVNGNSVHLYKYNLLKTYKLQEINRNRIEWLKKTIDKQMSVPLELPEIIPFISKIYEKGYSALDIIKMLEEDVLGIKVEELKKYELLIAFDRVRKEFRNEKLLIFFILNFIYLSSNISLENISFM